MERDVFRFFASVLRSLGRRRPSGRHRYTDAGILEVYLWATLNAKPVVWACDARNWPKGLRRGPLPSQSQVSRRLRSDQVRTLLARLSHACIQSARDQDRPQSNTCIIDGKAITIPLHSADAQAGRGRGVGHIALGYKMHTVVNEHGELVTMRLASLNVDEREMARRIVPTLPKQYTLLLGDSFYDSNPLHGACADAGVQLLAPRRVAGGRTGSRPQHPFRLLAIEVFEAHAHPHLREVHRRRYVIEHFFAWLTTASGGLQPPIWIRGYATTHRWITAKLSIAHARKALAKSRRLAAVGA